MDAMNHRNSSHARVVRTENLAEAREQAIKYGREAYPAPPSKPDERLYGFGTMERFPWEPKSSTAQVAWNRRAG